MLSEYNRLGASSGVSIKCAKECVALIPNDWKHYINVAKEKIIFLDENNPFILSKEFAETIAESDNYYVLIIRDSLPQFSYSIEEIYGFRVNRDSQKYIQAKHTYNEMYQLYNLSKREVINHTSYLIEITKETPLCYNKHRLNIYR
jgi:hypothetical protein